MILFRYLILIITLLSLSYFSISNAAINLSISPIKYELKSHTWWTLTREAKLTNHTSWPLFIKTWKSDFISNGEWWKPLFIRQSEVVFNQELSSWITIDTPSFNIWAWETKTINFTINVPANATPGWHYWAVFFKNDWSERASWTNVWINVDYWVLILLDIEWQVNSEIDITDPIITISKSSWVAWWQDVCPDWDKSISKYDKKCDAEIKNTTEDSNTDEIINEEVKEEIPDDSIFEEDECLIDLTSSNFDSKCINNIDEIVSEITWDINDIEIDTESIKEFDISIKIPIDNVWNTHVKPKWKITLYDEDWKELKKIWKEVITNDAWAIIWEKIVDYIPINDIWWNILPWTKRVYESKWRWFPYEVYNDEWTKEIKYWTPTEYYTKKNIEEKTFIMPWERISTKISTKNIKAVFDIDYKNENSENIDYNSAQEFQVEYTEKYVWYNPYFFLWLWLFWILLVLIIIVFKKSKKRCINKDCKKKIDRDLKICPYCTEKQEKKKKKKDEKKGGKKDIPIIIPVKKSKLKTSELKMKKSIRDILIKKELKYAEDISKSTKKDLLKIKWIWEKAIDDIKEALKEENLKFKK